MSFYKMFLVYIDDSGDEKVRCFSALLIHESVWRSSRLQRLDFRRNLKRTDSIFISKELHATEFVAGRGQIASSVVTKARRCEIYVEALRQVAALPKVRLLNAVSSKGNERMLFERVLTRLNRTMAEWKRRGSVIHDEGKDFSYLVRE